jgi:predicted permease
MPNPTRLYSWLLKLYPARFREEYAIPMERLFRDEYRETGGRKDRARLWLRVITDLVVSIPLELTGELKLDLKHALRVYRHRFPAVAAAVVVLGLAIGASTGVFSVLNALLFRSLPFSDAERLVELWHSPVGAGSGRSAFNEWRTRSQYLEDAAAFSVSEMNLTGERDALRVKVAETSWNFFQLLGTKPIAGRTFAAGEDVLGSNALAVISHSLWQQAFGGDPGVAGRFLHINGKPLTIIGVAPAQFDYPGNTNIWIPTVFDFEKVPKRGAFLLQTIGRLKPDISMQTARALFEAEVLRSGASVKPDEQNRARMISLRDQLAGSVRQASWVLAGMVLLVLLTACANLAHLLLTRATERQQELAIRAALGASRARLLQQLITEATALTLAGAAIGLVVAHWTAEVASSVAPAPLTIQQYTVLDWRVLAFAVTLALVMGLLFGVTPAWLIGRLQPSGNTTRIRSRTAETGAKRVRGCLVALQAALTLSLVSSSIIMGSTFRRLLDTELGFRPASVVTVTASLQGTRHRNSVNEWQYYSEALNRLREIPGVEAAGAVSHLPLANDIYMANAFRLDSGQTVQRIVTNAITPDYFRAMGTSFLWGRDFEGNRGQHSERVVIVNEAFAQSAGLGSTILGRRITAPWSNTPYRIIGVVSTTRVAGPAYAGGAQIYWPLEEEPPPALTFVAKVHGQAEEYLPRCRDAIRAVDPGVPVYDAKTLDRRLADALSRPRFYTTATLFLAGLAVLLAGAGIYGTAAHSVAQRKHEMGVRLALGASYLRIRSMMLRESLIPLGVGMTAGVAGSLASGRYLAHLMASAGPANAWTCMAGVGFLLLLGLLAAWRATARVLSVDPADAIRSE